MSYVDVIKHAFTGQLLLGQNLLHYKQLIRISYLSFSLPSPVGRNLLLPIGT